MWRISCCSQGHGVPPKVSQCHRDSEKSQHPQHTYAWDLGLPSIRYLETPVQLSSDGQHYTLDRPPGPCPPPAAPLLLRRTRLLVYTHYIWGSALRGHCWGQQGAKALFSKGAGPQARTAGRTSRGCT